MNTMKTKTVPREVKEEEQKIKIVGNMGKIGRRVVKVVGENMSGAYKRRLGVWSNSWKSMNDPVGHQINQAFCWVEEWKWKTDYFERVE